MINLTIKYKLLRLPASDYYDTFNAFPIVWNRTREQFSISLLGILPIVLADWVSIQN